MDTSWGNTFTHTCKKTNTQIKIEVLNVKQRNNKKSMVNLTVLIVHMRFRTLLKTISIDRMLSHRSQTITMGLNRDI